MTKSTDTLVLILIKDNVNRVIGSSSSLELILAKFKKTKLTISKILANSKYHINIKTIGFLILKARIIFTQLKPAFTEAPIL